MTKAAPPNREMPGTRDLDDLAEYFQTFGDVHVAKLSPLYAAFARHVAATPSLLRLAANATPGQPPANLLFASVQYLLRQDLGAGGLRAFYPTLGGSSGGDLDKACRLFEAFALKNQTQILPLLSTKITNTNEVGRCATLAVGFSLVAKEADHEPLHLIEIGPSVGLNLGWDHFIYHFGRLRRGALNSPVVLKPKILGEVPPHLHKYWPDVASRRGIEINFVDMDDEETLFWQLALVFPEHVDRAQRLKHAFAVARQLRPSIIVGDAVEMIDMAISDLPASGAVCVYHSQATYQIPRHLRLALSEKLKAAGRSRPIWRVGVEWLDGGSRGKDSGDSSLGLARYEGGNASYQHLAFCDPHGRRLEWCPTPPEDTDRL